MADVQKKIAAFLSVIFGGAAFAFIVAVFLITYYGPTGQYKLANVLLSPSTLESLNYTDKGFRGENLQFTYHSIEWRGKTSPEGGFGKRVISLKEYADLYQVIDSDVSLKEVPERTTDRFFQEPVGTLSILVRGSAPQSQGDPIVKVFQEVQFIQDDSLYRVQLHDDSAEGTWAYFEHQGVWDQLNRMSVANER